MKKLPKISESEWLVMKVLWASAPLTGNEVVEALAESTAWSPKTIKTLLNRLVKKKALGFEKQGRSYSYSPLVGEEDCARAETRSFLNRVHGGALRPMIANFLEEERLTAKEIEELKRMLDEKKGES